MRAYPFDVVISDTMKVENYFQIKLSDGAVLSVYNPCLFEGLSYADLKGCILKEIREDETANVIVLALDKGTLRVDVHPGAWIGPEAMTLYGSGHSIVIWN